MVLVETRTISIFFAEHDPPITQKFRWYPEGTTSTDLRTSVCDSFGLPHDTQFALYDADNHCIVFSPSTPSGLSLNLKLIRTRDSLEMKHVQSVYNLPFPSDMALNGAAGKKKSSVEVALPKYFEPGLPNSVIEWEELQSQQSEGRTPDPPPSLSTKPKPPKGPVNVEIGFTVFSIASVDIVAQTFYCDVKLFTRWKDPSLYGIDPDAIDWDKQFKPEIYVKNATQFKVVEDRLRKKEKNSDVVTHTTRIRGTMTEFLELWDFPFDRQDLRVVVATPQHVAKLIFVPFEGRKSILMGTIQLQEWSLLEPRVEFVQTDPSTSSTGVSYSEYHIVLQARRRPAYYVVNIMLVVAVLVSMGYYSAGIDPANLADRLNVLLTLILTCIAFKFMVSDCLPVIAYMTVLDKYVLISFFFLYLMAFENFMIAHYLNEICDTDYYGDPGSSAASLLPSTCDKGATLDDKLMNTWLILWALYHIVFLVYVLCIMRRNHAKSDDKNKILIQERKEATLISSPSQVMHHIHSPASRPNSPLNNNTNNGSKTAPKSRNLSSPLAQKHNQHTNSNMNSSNVSPRNTTPHKSQHHVTSLPSPKSTPLDKSKGNFSSSTPLVDTDDTSDDRGSDKSARKRGKIGWDSPRSSKSYESLTDTQDSELN
eukprot:TRINITY_DN15034_c0_g1::TRINITY_DN15034_c0_g1_i1::g.25023::m.25023 TRINITY_DN15034_c0_g1::TRINITY_DN15034_c0_g1_i1::g.25023  ORF type:complete len:651 (-),score=81.83,sp/O70212/5HT3A_CAVPO/23.83/2e-07,Neur_chan_LBD/PF02931.18/1.1e-05,Neur_chan_memb/PF02932.11/9.3,Neur_chan_memb/PF02932.11/0.81,MDFI/PF15316.1/6 TRINITY_DN15034_c0_g1_i1:113-2065(-)